MDSISSRWRKPKGRPSKRRKALSANALNALDAMKIKNDGKKNTEVDETLLKTESAAKKLSKYVEKNDPKFVEINSDTASSSNYITQPKTVDSTSEYIIINKSMWSALLQNVACSHCGNCALQITQHNSFGYSVKLELSCQTCGTNFGSTFTSEREAQSRKFDVNNKLVSAFLAIGRGHAALETFSTILGTPTMDRKTFAACLENVFEKSEVAKHEMLRISRETVRLAHLQADPSLHDKDIIDICVSYDGTWQKRGHTSLYGIGIVIDILTGLVVDFEILSKYCQECVIIGKDLGENSAEFHFWMEGHASSCQKNFEGSSGSMEMKAAYILWERSVAECRLRYTTVLSDGDAKTHQHLNDEKVYGPDTKIEKEECLNHVAKRLGTALRNKVKEWRVKGVTLGGRKKGSLTEATIVKLQNFYRKAIKDNVPNVDNMKTSVLATLFHCISTDAKPQHNKCPEGDTSWCFYKRAMACGNTPTTHKLMKTQLSEEVVAKILPVYQRLASDEILSRCIAANTQNANESLHSCIWRKCPKEVFVSKKRLEIAVTAAVSESNLGYVETLKLSNAECSALAIGQKRDARRVYQNKRKSSEQYKINKNRKKYKKMALAKSSEKKEGVTYGAGAF